MKKQEEDENIAAHAVRHDNHEGIDTGPQKVDEEQQQERGVELLEHTANGKERGKYKQYEDSQIIIEKIRSYRTQRYPDCEIMELLGNMPRRTYYNYVKKLQEQDKEIMEQWKAEHIEHVSEELMIYRETLCQKQREIQEIIEDRSTPAKDKMKAVDQYISISDKLVNFTTGGRLSKMKSANLDSCSPF
jgi:hypothetical protein